MENRKVLLSVDNLHVNFRVRGRTLTAIRGISLDFYENESVAIVGESGSGKSVSIKAIMGILAGNAVVDSGTIMYEGRNLLETNERDYHKIRGSKIGLIFQDPLSALNPIMKIGKQITETLKLNNPRMGKKEARQKAVELMESVGIPDADRRFDQYPFQFSGGMRQRIVIAIALARDPEILICDEPTTALDVTVQARILDLINRIKKERNISVIFITHDMGVVANMAQRVYVMYAGKIVEHADINTIFANPKHPYTWGLLASVPRLDSKNKDTLEFIPGTPPDLLAPPVGCPFAARCKYAMNICKRAMPPVTDFDEPEHYCSCWLYDPRCPKKEESAHE